MQKDFSDSIKVTHTHTYTEKVKERGRKREGERGRRSESIAISWKAHCRGQEGEEMDTLRS